MGFGPVNTRPVIPQFKSRQVYVGWQAHRRAILNYRTKQSYVEMLACTFYF